MTKTDFWKSAGMHLVEPDDSGWLKVTPDFMRAYYTRPEVHPVEDSCEEEVRLFEDLMNDPFMTVRDARLDGLQDQDVADNYRILRSYRSVLEEAGTIEGAYQRLIKSGQINIPPVFIDQMVHLIVRNILKDCQDPIRLRAAEIFFREQNVSVDDGRLLLADEEIVEMYASSGGAGGLGQLLVESDTPMKKVELDVLGEDNKDIYWERSDRFDTVVDFRFTQPALDAFARVVESWVYHFLKVKVRVQPRQSVQDDHSNWWHIGLDRESMRILDALYEGKTVPFETTQQLIALFGMEIGDVDAIPDNMKGKPIYLGLAMKPSKQVKMKPQNLLTNLPLVEGN